MSHATDIRPSKLLKFALRADAIACALFALVTFDLLVFSNDVVEQLDVPSGVLIGAGVIAFVGAPLLWSMVRRERLRRSSVWVLMVSNMSWAIVSIVAIAAGWTDPTLLGAAIIVGQALATALIAEMEFIGYRKSISELEISDNEALMGTLR